MIRTNICIGKYTNIFEYPNIRHALSWPIFPQESLLMMVMMMMMEEDEEGSAPVNCLPLWIKLRGKAETFIKLQVSRFSSGTMIPFLLRDALKGCSKNRKYLEKFPEREEI